MLGLAALAHVAALVVRAAAVEEKGPEDAVSVAGAAAGVVLMPVGVVLVLVGLLLALWAAGRRSG